MISLNKFAARFALALLCLSPLVLGGWKLIQVAGIDAEYPHSISWAWTTEEWTGSDRPYLQIRKEVDALVRQKRLTASSLRQVQSAAEEKPDDPQAQFRWGYALLKAPDAGIQLGRNVYDSYAVYTPVVRALARPGSPRSYQYARARFLLMTLQMEVAPLKTVGVRLLRRDPKDTRVKAYLVRYFSVSRSPEERRQALKYAQEIVHDFPKWPGSYNTLGGVYENALFGFGDLAAADKGIAAYLRYLDLLPPQARERQSGLAVIRIMRQEKARQQRRGFKPGLVVGR